MRMLAIAAGLLALAASTPAQKIKSGERVVTTTEDGATTAPYFVEGAEPGDLIVVSIEALDPKQTTGTSASLMTPGTVDAGAFGTKGAAVPWTIDKAKGVVRFDLQKSIPNVEWATRYTPPIYEMPLAPVLSDVGTAPGGKTTTAFPGARVMLPVNEPGALLTFGRGYARHGDGEVAGAGIEVPLEVTFSVDVVKKKEWPHSSVARASTIAGEFPIEWPRVESADFLMAAGTAPSLQLALQHATTELHHWLDDDFGFSERSLSIFLGPAIEYEVVSAAGPTYTVLAKVRRAYIPKIAAAK